MAITLSVSLTDEQQALMVQVANRVLPGSTAAQKKAWAEEMACDGLKAAIKKVAMADIDSDARDLLLATRQEFLSTVEAAWPGEAPQP